MGLVRTNDKYYKDIAKAIRAKNGTSTSYRPKDMPAAIAAIQGGEGAIGTYPVTVTPMDTEFTVYPDEGLAFSEVTVEGDENLIPENIAEGVSIYGVEGSFAGSSSDGLVLAMPEKYQEYVDYARENLYSGDYANIAVFDFQDWIAVSFFMENFEITSYDHVTTEFKAVGWHTCGYTKSTGEWTYNDYSLEESTGMNYINNIIFCTCYIEYNGEIIWPISDIGIVITDGAMLSAKNSWYKGSTDSLSVTKVRIVESYEETGTETETWNADVEDEGLIKCYISGHELIMDLVGNKYLYLNEYADNMFSGMTNLESIEGISSIRSKYSKSMAYMFYDCKSLTSLNISGFDTSNVIDMSYMFMGCSSLTSLDVSGFDTSNVVDISNMFYGCSSMEFIDISNFDLRNISKMRYLFASCTVLKSINLPKISSKKSLDVGRMFSACANLQSIDTDIFEGVQIGMADGLFQGCAAITNLDLKPINLEGVNCNSMFQSCSSIVNIDLSHVRDMSNISNMFYYCTRLETVNLGNFIGNRTPNVNYLFYNCSKLHTVHMDNFQGENVESMNSVARFCSKLTLNWPKFEGRKISSLDNCYLDGLSNINLESFIGNKLTGTGTLFGTNIVSLNIGKLDTSNFTTMANMFSDCKSLTSLNISGFDTSNVANMAYMFNNCYKLTSLNISGFDTSNVTNMAYMFYNCYNLTSLNISGFDTSNVTNMAGMFGSYPTDNKITSLDVSGFNTSKVTNMNSTFWGCSSLTSLDVSGFDTRNVTTMYQTFAGCHSLTSLDVSGFDTSNVTTMYRLFHNCESLTSLDVSGFDTSKVTNMSYMFYNCPLLESLDVSGFVTSNVMNMHGMFCNCESLTSLDVSGFVTSKISNTNQADAGGFVDMFSGCENIISLDTSNFETNKTVYMCRMFMGCSKLTFLDLTGLHMQGHTATDRMFKDCVSLTAVHVSEKWVEDFEDYYTFDGCKISSVTYV